MQTLLVATGNAHKTQEIAAILGPEWQVLSLLDYPQLESPEETGTTFEANARIKAEAASLVLPDLWVLADDSGLEVDALGRAPGVYSARYAGPTATDADNRQRLKSELTLLEQDLPGGWRGRFCCTMALARGGSTEVVCSGTVEGKIILEEAGSGGFGYDPLFVPEGYEQTFGLLPAETKNLLSHRARALAGVVEWLRR